MLITTNQIEMFTKSNPQNQFKHNKNPKLTFFNDNMNKVKLEKLERLKIEIREFYKNNRCVTVECEELIESIDKKIFDILKDN